MQCAANIEKLRFRRCFSVWEVDVLIFVAERAYVL